MIAVAAALLLLAESFGRNVIWLYRTGAGPRTRRALRLAITVLSVVLVWAVLVAPDRIFQLTPGAFARIPVEVLVLVAVALVLPPWPRRIVAAVAGILFGLITLAQAPQHRVLRGDRAGVQPGARLGRHRPGPRRGTRRDRHHAHQHRARRGLARSHPAHRRDHRINDSHHHRGRPASPRRGSRHSPPSPRSGRWPRACHCNSSRGPRSPRPAPPGWPSRRCTTPRKRSATSAISSWPCTAPTLKPASPLRTCSPDCAARTSSSTSSKATGRSPSTAPSFSRGVDAVLRQSTASLARAGWSTQSAWLGSPTYGGISWLAHSTLQSGLWVNTEQRYAELTSQQPVHPQ